MARKRSASIASRPSMKGVEAALKKFDYAKALEVAGQLLELEPGDENRTLYVRTLSACADGYLKQGKVKTASETLRLAERFARENEPARVDVSILHAKFGEFAKALELSNTPRVLAHIADLCVRRNRTDGAPAEIKTEFPYLQQAFAHYEAGRDDAARDALQKLGLTSPFLQWKLLLRGLIAFAMDDAARAIENWQRLTAEYLPATLAAPLRAAVDPAFHQSLPKDAATAMRIQIENLFSGGVAAALREIQNVTGREQRLAPVWKHVEGLMPKLRSTHPHLVARLGQVLYHAIVAQGEPNDLNQYRRYFPHPPDDPQFFKLQAQACEATDFPDSAVEHWQKYEAWLANEPLGWSPELLARSRAIVLHRIGGLIEDMNIADEAPAELQRTFSKLFGEPKPQSNFGNPDDYYRKSLELAPDWPEPAYDLFDRHANQNRWPAAERTATDFLARRPDDLEMLDRLIDAFREQGKYHERLAAARRAHAVNPLDESRNNTVDLAFVAAIRHSLIAGDFDACERLLAEAGAARERRCKGSFGSLRATLGRLRKQPDAVAAAEASALVEPEHRMAAALLLAVDGQLAKVKPAARKAAEDRLKTVFAEPAPTPGAVGHLLSTCQLLVSEGFDYRGRQAHEKKIAALAERTLKSQGSEYDFETLLGVLMLSNRLKDVLALTPKLASRFPTSPFFPLLEAQAMIMKGLNHRSENRARRLIVDAKRLAQASEKPHHRKLLEPIHEIEKQLRSTFGGLGSLFGGSFPFDGFDRFDEEDEI